MDKDNKDKYKDANINTCMSIMMKIMIGKKKYKYTQKIGEIIESRKTALIRSQRSGYL